MITKQYRYVLEPYAGPKSRHACPKCGKSRVFVLYIDTATKQPIHETVGRCNREANCGYHLKPSEFLAENTIPTHGIIPLHSMSLRVAAQGRNDAIGRRHHFVSTEPYTIINYQHFTPTLPGFESDNCFLQYLANLFGRERAEKAFMDYFIGTSKHWPGATIFWQIDKDANIRTGKIMLYDINSGRRVKQPFNHITWVHKVLDLQDFRLKQCFFGEHILYTYPKRTVAIVESEKTAVIASICYPKYTWLAAGSLTNLNADKCKVLRTCSNIILYPDIKGYEKWKQKAMELLPLKVSVSDLLEKSADEGQRANGYDLADYLVSNYNRPSERHCGKDARHEQTQAVTKLRGCYISSSAS